MTDTASEKVRPLRPPLRPVAPKAEAQVISAFPELRSFGNILKRRKLVVLGCTVGLSLLALLFVLQLTPVYTAEAVVMLNTRKSEVVDLQAVMSGLQSDEAVVRSEVEVLKSRALAKQVVDKLALMSNKFLNPALTPPSLWQRWNPFTLAQHLIHRWYLSGHATDEAEIEVPDQSQKEREIVVDRVLSNLVVFNDGRSYVMKIRYHAEDPSLAAKIANAFANEYLLSQLEAKFEATKRATDWLNEHLADLRKKVQESDQAVQLYMGQHSLVGSRDQTVTTQQLSELNSQLIIAKADRTQKQSNLQQALALVRSGNAESVGPVLASPLIQTLKAQETALMQKRAELSNRYSADHPMMINVQSELKQVKGKIQDEVNNVVRSMTTDVQAAASREATLTASIQNLQKAADAQDAAGVGLRELQREADANRTLYENLLNRFKQTSAQEDIQQADARLVSSASVPLLPTFPRIGLFTGFAFFVSFLTGIVIAFLLEHLDNGFRTADRIEQALGIPCFGYVPAIRSGLEAHKLVVEQPLCAYAEALRSIRTALRFSNVDHPPKVILVTSSVPNEGKTTFAASLARSVARSGGRALLIDCDLRHPSIGPLFEVPRGPGLVSYFKGKSDFARLIHVDVSSRLHYITAEEGTANPQDLLGSQHMRDVLEKLRFAYDLIVLDAPPILAVSDSIVLSHLVDATLFMIQWEKTPRQVAVGALKLLQTQGTGLAGAVLSRVDVRRHAKYGYGDAAYYYGRYRGYYGSTKGQQA